MLYHDERLRLVASLVDLIKCLVCPCKPPHGNTLTVTVGPEEPRTTGDEIRAWMRWSLRQPCFPPPPFAGVSMMERISFSSNLVKRTLTIDPVPGMAFTGTPVWTFVTGPNDNSPPSPARFSLNVSPDGLSAQVITDVDAPNGSGGYLTIRVESNRGPESWTGECVIEPGPTPEFPEDTLTVTVSEESPR